MPLAMLLVFVSRSTVRQIWISRRRTQKRCNREVNLLVISLTDAKIHTQVKLMLLGKANNVSFLKGMFDFWGSRLKEWESDTKGTKTVGRNGVTISWMGVNWAERWKDAQARFDGFAPHKNLHLMQKLATELKDIEESDKQFFQKAMELQTLCNKITSHTKMIILTPLTLGTTIKAF